MRKTIVFLIIFLLFGGFILFEFLKESSKPLAKVGDVIIKKEDLFLRKEVYIKCYKDDKKDESEVLAELIRDALEEAVLKSKYNLEPPESTLEEKAKWIDENTKDPETLSCIKAVYGRNKKAYLKNVVKPTLVNPKLHQMFSQDTLIHRQERKKIWEMMQKLKNNPDILPTLEGYGKFQTKYEENSTLKVSEYEIQFSKDPFIEKVLEKMKPGEIWSEIVEDDYSYKIVRLLGKDNEKYSWDGIVILKQSFDEWFKDYASKYIKIEIYDEVMKKNFLEKYPDLWWKNLFK